jgi:hypothetical protein
VRPVPSKTCASAGAFASAPTAAISPSRTTTVPFSIVGPETVTIRAFVIAYDCAPAEMANTLVAAKANKTSFNFIVLITECKTLDSGLRRE